MTTKTCTKCNETKATTEFYKHNTSPDGYKYECKTCFLIASRAYNKANVVRSTETTVLWRASNPARVAAYTGKGDAIKRAPDCIPDGFDIRATIPIYAERIRLTQETGVVHHVDHIIPLAAGGKHEVSNLQVLTAEENYKKGQNND